ncbi:MAG TPA: hypothetical protein VK171_04760 [Fimbriimonas sp.]|nr:hypothetical protein [Fimbriimonas sp.]
METGRKIEFDDLRRVHELTVQRFPHEYLDEGLGAVGLILYDPPKNAGYSSTPLNSVTFAGIGIDGIHFGSLTDTGLVDPMAPVVVTIPMSLGAPNFIVGESLYDFLCLGCRHGFSRLGDLHLDYEGVLDHYQNPPGEFFDERAAGILQTLSEELSLVPWQSIRPHFEVLQSKFLPLLNLPS